jgi:hypothetical protein
VSLAAAALGTGCASLGTPNVDAGYRPAHNGLLVAAVSASGYLPGTLWFQVVPQGATAPAASIPVNDAAYGIDWPAGDSEIPHGGLGRLAVVELPPGAYELRRWVINVSNAAAYTSNRPFGLRFTIAPGKATYLGSVHVDIQRGASTQRLPFAVRHDERRDRDLPLLYRKNPGINAAMVIFAGEAEPEGARRVSAQPRGPARLEDLRDLLPQR